jgi:Ca2+-binding EF-hand superfamily protein
MVGPAKPPPPAAAGPLSAATADCILLHYDSNRDGLLTKNEMEAALFTALDKNGDGKLTRDELKAWRAGAPDLIVTVSTGNKPDHCSVDISAPGGGTLPPWAAVNRVDRSHIVLRADGRVIEFAAPVGSGNTVPLDGEEDLSWPAGPNNRPSAVVREADLSNQNQVFRVLFDHMDADGNGTVTYDEYRSYMILQRSTAGFPVTVSYSTRSVDLFKRLDTNRDGRLSARELRAAYETLRPLDPSPDPVVTHAALEPSAVFQIGRPSGTAGPQANPPPPGLTAFVDESAPLWFRKMDVNGDGEITKKEFLGSAEHFKRLDTNGDGVISLEEANAYEAKRKK